MTINLARPEPNPLNDICFYCLVADGRITKEHVLAHGFFDQDKFPYRSPLIIPACHTCNNLKSLQDEKIIRRFSLNASDLSLAARAVAEGAVTRSVRKWAPAKRDIEKMFGRMTLTDRHPCGIALPEIMTKIDIPVEENELVTNYVSMMARGLFGIKFGKPLSSDMGVMTFPAINEMRQLRSEFRFMLEYIKKSEWVLDNAPVFVYGIGTATEGKHHVCITEFYGVWVFVSFIAPREWLDERKRNIDM